MMRTENEVKKYLQDLEDKRTQLKENGNGSIRDEDLDYYDTLLDTIICLKWVLGYYGPDERFHDGV